MKPPFPSVIDSSMIAAFRSCGQKGNLEFLHHWRPQSLSVHLHAGGAYAAGLEAARTAYYVEGRSTLDAHALGLKRLLEFYGDFECPADSAKSCERTAGALEFYFERYPLGVDEAVPITLPSGRRGIELSFAEPVDLDDPTMRHPETGDPLIYCGRSDMVVDYQGMVLGEDDKTATQLGASWSRQWDLRSQFTGYSWGFRRMGIPIMGWLIRGVSILKTKYDTLQAITYRPEWQIERWHAQLKKDIRRMRAQWEAGEFDFNLDHACTEYGGCPFRDVCLMNQPDMLLEQRFERRRWDPQRRIEVPMTIVNGQLVEAGCEPLSTQSA